MAVVAGRSTESLGSIQSKFTHVKPAITAVWKWMVGPTYVWLAVAVTGFALAVAFGGAPTEPKIRITGLVLQVLGILTVVWGISETRRLYGLPSIASKVAAFFEAFPLRRRSVVVAAGGGSIRISGGKARAYGTHGPGENPTVDSRLAALERNIASIHERITSVERDIEDEVRKAADALATEARARETEDRSIRERLETTSTGGIHISAIGTVWLLFGVLMSTASVELAKWLG